MSDSSKLPADAAPEPADPQETDREVGVEAVDPDLVGVDPAGPITAGAEPPPVELLDPEVLDPEVLDSEVLDPEPVESAADSLEQATPAPDGEDPVDVGSVGSADDVQPAEEDPLPATDVGVVRPTEPDALEPSAAAVVPPVEPDAVPSLEPDAAPALGPQPVPRSTPRSRLRTAMRPRASRGQLLAGLLCFLLTFSLIVQARQNQVQGFAGLRQSDLVGILDNVSDRSNRLEDEATKLQTIRDQLRSGTDRSQAAQNAARERLDVLGILAGTVPATGPGIALTISDPKSAVTAAILLDTLQELRDAGAEAVQIGSVRVVASTSFTDVRGLRVDDTPIVAPYEFMVIGDPQTLSAALDIPGGVREVLRQKGASGAVRQLDSVTISALRTVSTPQYARPATAG